MRGDFVDFPHEPLLKEDNSPLYHNSFLTIRSNLMYQLIVEINRQVNTIIVGPTFKAKQLFFTTKI